MTVSWHVGYVHVCTVSVNMLADDFCWLLYLYFDASLFVLMSCFTTCVFFGNSTSVCACACYICITLTPWKLYTAHVLTYVVHG